jgi:hypothetical protein
MAIRIVAINTCPGPLATAVPIRRHSAPFGRVWGRAPRIGATTRIAAASVSEAARTTSSPTEHGAPRLSKYGSRQKLRHAIAPATVRPDPTITWAVPLNVKY